MRRVCLVGAGKVAEMHAPVLSALPDVDLVAICDPDVERRERLAEQYGVSHRFADADEAIASRTFDFAHVLVPPEHHASVALKLIAARIGVLVEKPMGRSAEECETMVSAGRQRRVQLGVNHNSLFYPAYLKLRTALIRHSLGALEHLIVTVTRPRQWLVRQSPWLHERPQHLAYESAVHPLAQVYDLAGTATELASIASGRHELRGGLHFFDTWQASLVCERATAQLSLRYGEFPTYQLLAVCHDGLIAAEIESNRCTAIDRTRWGRTRFGRYLQPMHVARRAAWQELAHGLENLRRELSPPPGAPPSPTIYLTSMQQSIAAFHRGPSPSQPRVDGKFGTRVVAMCDELTRAAGQGGAPRPRRRRDKRGGHPDAVVLGGTGMIGAELVDQLTSEGMTVRVVARYVAGLPRLFDKPSVQLLQGDIADPATISAAVQGTRAVVHLADRRNAISWNHVESAAIEPTRILAESSMKHGVERLVCAGSITSLDLADPGMTITGATPIDPTVSATTPYEWAKARLEQFMTSFELTESLPVCILRPGIVLGPGGDPFHPGLGVWRGETHCVGWNAGTNGLPLVLATDVAKAIRLALGRAFTGMRTYNLVGDVRLPARECIEQLAAAVQRPLVFHPGHPAQHYGLALVKSAANTMLARPRPPAPSYRMFKSKGCWATFDCSDVKRELGWRPVADRGEFIELGFHVHARATLPL